MADDERLREALLELQVLRERESEAFSETSTLLECLEEYSNAGSARQSLDTVFNFLANRIGVRLSILCRQSASGVEVVAGPNHLIGSVLVTPFDVFSRARNMVDMYQPGAWSGVDDTRGIREF